MGQMNFYSGKQLGAPALGTLGVGDLVRILDAALVNGFTAQSCTVSVTGAIATVSLAANTYRVGQRITIAGVTGGPTGFAALNATKRILTEGTNSFTLDATGVSNGAATGTITAKLAPLGFGIAFTATNQRAYRAATGLRHYLMADDNANTNTCIVRAFTAMTAVTTGTGPFPTATQSSTSLRWARPDPTTYNSTVNGAGPTYDDSWVIVGDDKRFMVGVCFQNTGYRDWYYFGEFQSFKPSDAFNTFMGGHANTDGTDTPSITSRFPKVDNPQISIQTAGAYYNGAGAVARAHGQVTASWLIGLLPPLLSSEVYESSYSGSPAEGTSSPISAGIEIGGCVEILEFTSGSNYYRRGRLPILQPWNSPDFFNNDFKVYSNITNFGDVLLVRGQYANQSKGLIFPVGDWDTVLA